MDSFLGFSLLIRTFALIMKRLTPIAITCLLLFFACGQSYEETKRISRQQRLETAKKDSSALKIAVMPTLDCLPFYVAEYYELLDTLRGGVRLKQYMSQMDCDTAMERGRVEGTVTDLVRAKRMERRGLKLRYTTVTNAYWQLITNRNSRIKQLKQLDDKMVAMTRYSATDLLTDHMIDSVKIDKDRVFKVQINDVNVRLLMLQNNEMDALWLTEPQATAARLMKHAVVYDTKKEDLQLGVIVFREKEMQRQARSQQFELLMNAYNQACDSINKYGVHHYRDLIEKRCHIKPIVVDSLPKSLKYSHSQGPREKDLALVEKWLGPVTSKKVDNKTAKGIGKKVKKGKIQRRK